MQTDHAAFGEGRERPRLDTNVGNNLAWVASEDGSESKGGVSVYCFHSDARLPRKLVTTMRKLSRSARPG